MINYKETLKKLHKKFPCMSLDELFEIADCFVEESLFTQPFNNDYWKLPSTPNKPWDNGIVYCSEKQSEPNQFCTNKTSESITTGSTISIKDFPSITIDTDYNIKNKSLGN